jgi:hypothetical protein
MPKRKLPPQHDPDITFVKQELVPSDDELNDLDEVIKSEPDEDYKDVKRAKKSSPKTKSTTKPKSTSKPGRKPGVAYTSKKWSGAELRQLFLLGLGGTEHATVPAARFDKMPGRSMSQCTNAWR